MMTLTQEDLSVLEKKYAMYVLLALDKNPMSTKTEIMRMEPGNEKTKFLRLQELIKVGLIEYRQAPSGVQKMVLTPEGQDIVNKIKRIRLTLLKLQRNSAASAEGSGESDSPQSSGNVLDEDL